MRITNRLAKFAAVAAFAGLGVAATARAGVVIGTGTAASGHQYRVIADDTLNWTAAAAAARDAGGYLATAGNAEEQAFIEDLLTDADAADGAYWFGLSEVAEGDYRHLSGRSPAYTNWFPGEPNDFAGVENSGAILWSDTDPTVAARRGQWNDMSDTTGYPDSFTDLVVKGYLIEFHGTGAGFDSGDGDNMLLGGQPGPNPVPLPAAAWLFPLGAAVAGVAARRLRRG